MPAVSRRRTSTSPPKSTGSSSRTPRNPIDHTDHVNLIRDAVEGRGATWADLGAGSGAFTLALADLLGPGARIFAVDRDAAALERNRAEMTRRFPSADVEYRAADFTRPLDLPPLDGVLMANSLHYQRDQPAVLEHIKSWLAPAAPIVIVEYNTDRSSPAVPYPVPFSRWQDLARNAGFAQVRLLFRRPSRWNSEIYSAIAE